MIRELIIPVDNTYTLNLPDEMVGKTVEVIAFEVEDIENSGGVSNPQTIQNIKERYSHYPVISHENYRFSRDEANDYE